MQIEGEWIVCLRNAPRRGGGPPPHAVGSQQTSPRTGGVPGIGLERNEKAVATNRANLWPGAQFVSHRLVNAKTVSVKVFGCRPHDDGATHSGAGVRKPPREETAGRRALRSVRRYGDFGAGGLLPTCVDCLFGK